MQRDLTNLILCGRAAGDGGGTGAMLGCCAAAPVLGASLSLSPSAVSRSLHLPERPHAVELLLRWPVPGAPAHPRLCHRATPLPQPPFLCSPEPTTAQAPGSTAGEQHHHTLVPLLGQKPRRPAWSSHETLGPTGLCLVGPHPAVVICWKEPTTATTRGWVTTELPQPVTSTDTSTST